MFSSSSSSFGGEIEVRRGKGLFCGKRRTGEREEVGI